MTESEKRQEPRNQVPEEGFESEEGLVLKSCIKVVKQVIDYSIVTHIHLIIGEYFQI